MSECEWLRCVGPALKLLRMHRHEFMYASAFLYSCSMFTAHSFQDACLHTHPLAFVLLRNVAEKRHQQAHRILCRSIARRLAFSTELNWKNTTSISTDRSHLFDMQISNVLRDCSRRSMLSWMYGENSQIRIYFRNNLVKTIEVEWIKVHWLP